MRPDELLVRYQVGVNHLGISSEQVHCSVDQNTDDGGSFAG